MPPIIPKDWQIFFCSGIFSLQLSSLFFHIRFQKFDLFYLHFSVKIAKSAPKSPKNLPFLLSSATLRDFPDKNFFVYKIP